jgi:hypothetical protein
LDVFPLPSKELKDAERLNVEIRNSKSVTFKAISPCFIPVNLLPLGELIPVNFMFLFVKSSLKKIVVKAL